MSDDDDESILDESTINPRFKESAGEIAAMQQAKAVFEKSKNDPVDPFAEIIERAEAEMNKWQIEQSVDGMDYVVLNLEDWQRVVSIADRKERFQAFRDSILYFGADAGHELFKRGYGHNKDFSFTGIDKVLFQRRLRNEKNVIIYFTGPAGFENIPFVIESVLISQSRILKLRTENIHLGHDITRYISNFDTSRFDAVFDAIVLQALDNPIRFMITNDQHIQAAQRKMNMAEDICVVQPFTRFVHTLMNELYCKGSIDVKA